MTVWLYRLSHGTMGILDIPGVSSGISHERKQLCTDI